MPRKATLIKFKVPDTKKTWRCVCVCGGGLVEKREGMKEKNGVYKKMTKSHYINI